MTTFESRTHRPRADKERNRTHILEVAEAFFSQQGVGGSLDAIAKRAGVGPGTLYRHFPTREALIASLLQARYDELFAGFEAIRGHEGDSGAALEEWLEALHAYVTAFDGLPDPLRIALSEESSPLAFTCQAVISATEELLTAAQREGSARPWVRAQDLFLSVLATAWVGGAALADEASGQALRAILREGWKVPAPGPAQ
ncbi:TetR/AcrR family transcriptional regulator [Citricoccus sp. K5]|uniref:TetR/AcrR family transcriptional regulator n=1 Tax=Citricoccus sp. K5 TaxID=2653135 RepID=UPI0027381651|nr:TetR/AcrR family transcriptional regulator [Citricoccus sp. K5]